MNTRGFMHVERGETSIEVGYAIQGATFSPGSIAGVCCAPMQGGTTGKMQRRKDYW